MSLLNRRRVILAKIESVYGTDPVPDGANNSILVKNLSITPQEATLVSRDLIRPFFGNFNQLPAAVYAKVSFDVEIAGAGTAGTAPKYGPLLRACAFSETLLAAAATGTAVGGGTNTIQLAAGASAVDNTYQGMEVSITGGTGSGQKGIIASYVGATKTATMFSAWTTPPNATSTYSIAAQAIYRPVSTGLEGISIYFNMDGVLHKLIASRGTVSFKLNLWNIPVMSFEFTGTYTTPTDVALPTAVYSGFVQPLTVNSTNTTGLNILGLTSAVMSDFNLSMTNSVTYRSLVGGTQEVVLTDRRPAGDINFEATTVAVKDWWTPARDGTLGTFWVTHGTVAGNIVQMSAPQIQIAKPSYEDKDGVAMLKAQLFAVPLSQNDEFFFAVK